MKSQTISKKKCHFRSHPNHFFGYFSETITFFPKKKILKNSPKKSPLAHEITPPYHMRFQSKKIIENFTHFPLFSLNWSKLTFHFRYSKQLIAMHQALFLAYNPTSISSLKYQASLSSQWNNRAPPQTPVSEKLPLFTGNFGNWPKKITTGQPIEVATNHKIQPLSYSRPFITKKITLSNSTPFLSPLQKLTFGCNFFVKAGKKNLKKCILDFIPRMSGKLPFWSQVLS